MRIAVLADVHGNLPALEAVIAGAHEQGVDAFASVGDMTSGVWANEVVACIGERARWWIAGNHESYYVTYDQGIASRPQRRGRQWAGIRWCYNALSRPTLDILRTLPRQSVIAVDGAPRIRLLHGSPQSIAGRLYPDENDEALAHFRRAGLLPAGEIPPLSTALADVAEPVVVCGHTHIPWVQRNGGRLAVNAGAVGGALNGDWRAQYAILSWSPGSGSWHVQHRAIPYDVKRVRDEFERSGYLKETGAFGRAILLNIETGLNWPGALLRHVRGFAEDVGWEDTSDVPDDLWDAAGTTFEWEAYRWPGPEDEGQDANL